MDIEKHEIPEWLKEYRTDAIRNCPILYCGTKKSARESLMCFGWECGNGWNVPLSELSYKLEALNLQFYPKYRTRIEAVQVKEKFGTLRFYYDMHIDAPIVVRTIPLFFRFLHDFMRRHIDYKYETIIDVPEHTTEEWDEIGKEDFDKKSHPEYVSNDYGWKFKEENGKYYRNCCLHHSEQSHRIPTKNKFLHIIMNIVWKIYCFVDLTYSWKQTDSQKVICNYMDVMAKNYIRDAEKECMEHCEECGAQINTDYEPICQTRGWIRYLCEDCAKINGGEYIKNGCVYGGKDGHFIKKFDKKEIF